MDGFWPHRNSIQSQTILKYWNNLLEYEIRYIRLESHFLCDLPTSNNWSEDTIETATSSEDMRRQDTTTHDYRILQDSRLTNTTVLIIDLFAALFTAIMQMCLRNFHLLPILLLNKNTKPKKVQRRKSRTMSRQEDGSDDPLSDTTTTTTTTSWSIPFLPRVIVVSSNCCCLGPSYFLAHSPSKQWSLFLSYIYHAHAIHITKLS
jgi:hypothetical protein